jgi:NitT/TauT family transport system permease protein
VGDTRAIIGGLVTLILVIVALDQFVWRPVLAWANKFKVETVGSDDAPTSWFLDVLSRSWLGEQFTGRVMHPFNERLDGSFVRRFKSRAPAPLEATASGRPATATIVVGVVIGLIILYGGYQAVLLAMTLPAAMWPLVGLGVLATLTRVLVALAITLLWTIPVGVAIGTNARLARFLQPVVQVVAAIPATAIFPVLLLVLLQAPGGLNLAAVLLMLLGTQWYLLFNIIAGSTAIPQDLKFSTELLQLSRRDRWRTLILPALFPFIITGAITASGGAWNASIVAEQVQFGGQTYTVLGVGALIAQATGSGNYALLLVATAALVGTVIAINRLVWRRMYHLAETRYRMD